MDLMQHWSLRIMSSGNTTTSTCPSKYVCNLLNTISYVHHVLWRDPHPTLWLWIHIKMDEEISKKQEARKDSPLLCVWPSLIWVRDTRINGVQTCSPTHQFF
ncbi:unnamed protein product [Sphenostylis stenocarpa]|uniref:Uncharacterized protein n=1 Tax=Sphenostylis stenocarpa TaxID=92480 RepID=A0AA86S004_9FABA|nr:unnamed protein product [Sphenostylis stenocarpa]